MGKIMDTSGTTHICASCSTQFEEIDLRYYAGSYYCQRCFNGILNIKSEKMVNVTKETKFREVEDSVIKESSLDKQIGGTHYKDVKIQPVEYIHANNLGFIEGCVVKYVTRHSSKNGKEDLKKAIHFLEMLIDLEYPE